MKIRTKFILFTGIVLASLMATIIFYVQHPLQKTFEKQILSTLHITTEGYGVIYVALTSHFRTLAIDWSSDPYIKNFSEKILDKSLSPIVRRDAASAFNSYLQKEKLQYNKSIVIVDLLDETGIVVGSSSKEQIGRDEKKEEEQHQSIYFSEALKAGFGETFVRSAVYEKDEYPEPMAHVTTRVFSAKHNKDGTFKPLNGVLLIHFVPQVKISDFLTELNKTRGNTLESVGLTSYIVNKDRLIITSILNNVKVEKKSKIDIAPVKKCFDESKNFLGEYINYQGETVLGSSVCARDEGIVLISEMPKEKTFSIFNTVSNNILAELIIVFSLVVLAIFIFFRHPLRQLSEIVTAANKISDGDFTVHIKEGGSSEFGVLSHSFNLMVDKFQSYYQSLEETVKQKTSSIEADKGHDEALLNSLGEGVISINNQEIITVVNDEATKILELTKADLLGKDINEFILMINEREEVLHKSSLPTFQAMNTRSTINTKNITLVQKDGGKVPVSLTASPIIIKDEMVGVVTIFRDITEEKKVEKMRQDLLSLASHQLRTPLSGTKWLIETLKRGIHGILNNKQTEYIDEIYRINERMTDLVSDMLNALRIESGIDSFKNEEYSTSLLFESIATTMGPAARARQITLHFSDKNIPLMTAPELLRNILDSFVSNAIIYSPSGSEVFIDSKKDGEDIIFSVKDSGIGIPEGEQGPIFSRFYRASNAKTFNTKSSGLGLYIAATLAEKIGAKVYFESEENKGSTFFVRGHFQNPEKGA